ncbi:MAG: thioredoxin family protein [Eubacteriales bacterium]|nr:thioredoxin family protein [Eubacteriales bacterium]
MALFGKRKKEERPACCSNFDAKSMAEASESKGEGARVKILGSGCKKCNALEAATRDALGRLGMDTAIDHVTDFAKIAAYGVMTTPALVVDDKVISYGKVLSADEVASLLEAMR